MFRKDGGGGAQSTLVETVSINYEDFNESFLTCSTCLCNVWFIMSASDLRLLRQQIDQIWLYVDIVDKVVTTFILKVQLIMY